MYLYTNLRAIVSRNVTDTATRLNNNIKQFHVRFFFISISRSQVDWCYLVRTNKKRFIEIANGRIITVAIKIIATGMAKVVPTSVGRDFFFSVVLIPDIQTTDSSKQITILEDCSLQIEHPNC